MKVLNLLFIALFLFSAVVQYNDPDPYLWMPIYLYGAALCFLALRKKYNIALYIIGLVTYSGLAIYHFVGDTGVLAWMTSYGAESLTQSMKATKPWIEETREFLGLILLIAAVTANMAWLARAKRTAVSQLWKQLLTGEILKER
jgi:hypothetical protein